MKTEAYSSLTYWHVFTPLFIVTALNLYFLFIVLVRAVVEEKQCKDPILKYFLSYLFFSYPETHCFMLRFVGSLLEKGALEFENYRSKRVSCLT